TRQERGRVDFSASPHHHPPLLPPTLQPPTPTLLPPTTTLQPPTLLPSSDPNSPSSSKVNAPPLDFDSSDFELLEEEEPSRKPKRGERITKAILENQAIDRLQSKKALRTLTYSFGAPGTRLHQESVTTSWDGFCQTVSHDITTCPSGDLIFRYVDTIARNTKPGILRKPAPSLVVIQAGKLIRGDWFKKMWIGFMLVLKMATAWVKDAFENGTHSWDITISKLASIVIQSALSSRSGDITRSQLYEGIEYLCWGHITFTLESPATRDAPSVQDLKGTFELQFTKGHKSTRNATHTLFCDPLENPSQSVACPIKLLLVLALRLGYVYGRTIEDCLAHTARRMDRTIQWKVPNAPVFCKMNGNSAFLKLDEPAGQHQVRYTLQQMALLTGILDRVDSRGIRRGALRDQAYLDRAMTGVATRCTALIAGHSSTAFARGTTQDYVGALEHPIYNMRADLPRKDRMAPAVATQGGLPIALRQYRTSPHEVDEFMKAQHMDVSDKNQRKMATRLIKKQKIADWCLEARNESAPISPAEVGESGTSISALPNVPVPKKKQQPSGSMKKQTVSEQAQSRQNGPEPLRQRTTGEVNTSQGRISSKRKASDDNATEAKRSLLQPPSSATTRPEWLDPELFEANVDPAELDALTDAVFAREGDRSDNALDLDSVQTAASQIGAVHSDSLQTDAVDEAMIDEVITGNPVSPDTLSTLSAPWQAQQQPLEAATISGNNFVNFYSTVNVFQNQARFDRNDMVEAGKDSQGRSCLSASVAAAKEASKQNMSLRCHVSDVHDYKPVACDKCPDQPNVVYGSKKELKKHRDSVHCVVEKQHCPLQDQCGFVNEYTQKRLLRQHLVRKHHLTNEQIKKYVPDGRKGHSNNKGKKRKPKGWHLAAGGVEKNEALDESGGDGSSDGGSEGSREDEE
ncbi:hypothetical protein V501_07977, partial [Pseudogymnoascus sp. VKM F-4519 (FW-2642)]